MPHTADTEEDRLAVFIRERKRLTRLAYRYLGSASEAEDVVQDCWLRFSGQEQVEAPERYLSRIVTRLCLDRLKSARHRRETYVGPWLPEPVLDEPGAEAEAGDAALDISFAVMRALERLSPLERAAFFLHDLYDVPFEEVAKTIGRTPAACRQLASRGRKALGGAAARYRASTEQVSSFVDAITAVSRGGELEPLRELLAADVEFISDGGGKKAAALNVVGGRDNVARLLMGIARKALQEHQVDVRRASINGEPALLLFLDGELDQTISVDINAAGEIATIYLVRNPDKLDRARRLKGI